jgi:hypothetical protein
MKAVSLNEIKKELTFLEPQAVQELCLRLARFKQENKELLTYLLFEAHDENTFVENTKLEIAQNFEVIPSKSNLYLAKKSIRKILRLVNKVVRYSGIKKSEVELRIWFLAQLNESAIKFHSSPVLVNLYNQQVKKINAAMVKLPEELQFDYQQEMKTAAIFYIEK